MKMGSKLRYYMLYPAPQLTIAGIAQLGEQQTEVVQRRLLVLGRRLWVHSEGPVFNPRSWHLLFLPLPVLELFEPVNLVQQGELKVGH